MELCSVCRARLYGPWLCRRRPLQGSIKSRRSYFRWSVLGFIEAANRSISRDLRTLLQISDLKYSVFIQTTLAQGVLVDAALLMPVSHFVWKYLCILAVFAATDRTVSLRSAALDGATRTDRKRTCSLCASGVAAGSGSMSIPGVGTMTCAEAKIVCSQQDCVALCNQKNCRSSDFQNCTEFQTWVSANTQCCGR